MSRALDGSWNLNVINRGIKKEESGGDGRVLAPRIQWHNQRHQRASHGHGQRTAINLGESFVLAVCRMRLDSRA